MAEKEATIFIVDLGSTMSEKHGGRDETDLDWAMRYVWGKILSMAGTGRKTVCAGVVGLRTDDSNNPLHDDDGYDNISVLQDLGPVTMQTVRNLQAVIQPSSSWSGDAVSAIVVAVHLMEIFTKKLKWKRRIVLVTDGEAPIDADDTTDIAKRIQDSGIELTVLGVDFDDREFGFKEEDKSKLKSDNEKHLKDLTELCPNGVFATIAEAIDDLETPSVKQIKPYKAYDGTLTLGNPEEFPTSMAIPVERYFKTHRAIPPSASTVVVKGEGTTEAEQGTKVEDMEGVEFSAVKSARTYKVNDPGAPGGKKDVEFESLAKGYEYGRTAVYISEAEYNITKLESVKGFSVLGFVHRSKYEPFLNMGETGVTVPRKGDVEAQLALSSFVWALEELESYAVARIVAKDAKDPLLVLLVPSIEGTLECLYDVPLPFAEDVRSYQFPPLDRIITISGATLTKHRLLPTEELAEAMSDYVDGMDLSTFGQDFDGNPAEYARIEESYSPAIHRINRAVRARALNPDKPVPEMPQDLLQFSVPPRRLAEKVRGEIEKLIEVAEVKKVPPKAKGKRVREVVKPISGLDIDALLGPPSKEPISENNTIPDYKRCISNSVQASDMEDASKRMGEIIRKFIAESSGYSLFDRALENMSVMRTELLDVEEPEIYNKFMLDLKKRVLSGELGGDRRDFWYMVKKARLGLIDQAELQVSTTTEEQAQEFFKQR